MMDRFHARPELEGGLRFTRARAVQKSRGVNAGQMRAAGMTTRRSENDDQRRPRKSAAVAAVKIIDVQDRCRADQQGLLAATLVEEPVSEDMAAVQIGGELNFIDRHEIKIEVARHRLHRRDVIARPFWLDFLLPGNEGDGLGASFLDDAIEYLAREQSKRQSDRAAFMRQHALDGVMRLTGIGWPEHGGDAFVRIVSLRELAECRG